MNSEKNTHKEWALKIQWKEEMLVEKPTCLQWPHLAARVDPLLPLEMVIPPLIWNPYSKYINPDYWVDFPIPLLYGKHPSPRHIKVQWSGLIKVQYSGWTEMHWSWNMTQKKRAQILGGWATMIGKSLEKKCRIDRKYGTRSSIVNLISWSWSYFTVDLEFPHIPRDFASRSKNG